MDTHEVEEEEESKKKKCNCSAYPHHNHHFAEVREERSIVVVWQTICVNSSLMHHADLGASTRRCLITIYLSNSANDAPFLFWSIVFILLRVSYHITIIRQMQLNHAHAPSIQRSIAIQWPPSCHRARASWATTEALLIIIWHYTVAMREEFQGDLSGFFLSESRSHSDLNLVSTVQEWVLYPRSSNLYPTKPRDNIITSNLVLHRRLVRFG